MNKLDLDLINEARRLIDLGFDCIPLKPRDKRPMELGWTKKERMTCGEFESFISEKAPNIGIRTGRGRLGNPDQWLIVIDCDLKSSEPKHEKEMLEALEGLIGKLPVAPKVMSGRGNGSLHVYISTIERIDSGLWQRSKDQISILGGSKPESKISQMRPAWQIEILSDGRQVVAPPSIHPETGKLYSWAEPLVSIGDIPTVPKGFFGARPQRTLGEKSAIQSKPFQAVAYNKHFKGVAVDVIKMIRTGEGSGDRSNDLFKAAIALVRAGFTDDEVVSALVDRNNLICIKAYENRATASGAADWVRQYCLAKAKRVVSGAIDFDQVTDIESLESENPDVDLGEMKPPEKTWRDELVRNEKKKILKTFSNLISILENEIGCPLARYDEFRTEEIWGLKTPFGFQIGTPITDADILALKAWLSQSYSLDFGTDVLHEAITLIAHKNRFHPVRDYLNSLEWDNVPRIDSWLKKYVGATAPEPYLSEVSRKILIAMVKRVMVPGCKFDYMPILEGFQGVGKSTLVRTLAGEFFGDTTLEITDKDAVQAIAGIWIYEFGELSTMSRADVNHLKVFVTSQCDRVRMPYGRKAQNFPRQCVFIGTTNNSDYLKDTTGNRRFWPIEVTTCDFEGLASVRDQLFAEAFWQYQTLDEDTYLSPEAESQAHSEQLDRTQGDELDEELEILLKKLSEKNSESDTGFDINGFSIYELIVNSIGNLDRYRDKPGQMRIADSLKRLGYRSRKRDKDRRRIWVKFKKYSTRYD